MANLSATKQHDQASNENLESAKTHSSSVNKNLPNFYVQSAGGNPSDCSNGWCYVGYNLKGIRLFLTI